MSETTPENDKIERACEVMHDAYERAAVGAGWETNPASRKPWADVPESNKVTMRAAVAALIEHLEREGVGSRYAELYEDEAGEHRFRIFGGNHEQIDKPEEGFSTRGNAKRALRERWPGVPLRETR